MKQIQPLIQKYSLVIVTGRSTITNLRILNLVGTDEDQKLSDDVNSCIDFVNNTQWIQNEGKNLMDGIVSQINQYINELEESINYDKR